MGRQSLSSDRTLIVDDVVLQPTDTVRDLGVPSDSELTMKQHVNLVRSTCVFHLRRLRQLNRHVTLHTLHEAFGIGFDSIDIDTNYLRIVTDLVIHIL